MQSVVAAMSIAISTMVLTPDSRRMAGPPAHAQDRWIRVHLGPEDRDVLSYPGIDALADHPQPGWVDVIVDPYAWPGLLASDLELVIVRENLGEWLLEERGRLGVPSSAGEDFLATYRSLEEIEEWLTLVVDEAAAPERIAKIEIGRSLEDRPIHALEIGPVTDPEAPVLIVQAGQHAREWIAVMASLCLVDTLVHAPEATLLGPLLDRMRFVVVPVSNPDGYTYSWDEDRLWRKNRRDGVGVDTNRNFGTQFGGPGSSDDPRAANYRGTAAFSEPETAAIRDLARSYPNLRGYVDLHSFGQLVLHPWGFPTEEPPAAIALFEAIGNAMAAAILDAEGSVYEPISALELYPSAGASDDWVYGERGAVAFALELRPDHAEESALGFVLDDDQIPPVCHEVQAAIETLALAIVDLEPLPAGDGGSPIPEEESSSSGEVPWDDDGTSASTGSDDPDASTTAAPDPRATESSSESTTSAAAEVQGGCACSTPGPQKAGASWLAMVCVAVATRRRAVRATGTRHGARPRTRS